MMRTVLRYYGGTEVDGRFDRAMHEGLNPAEALDELYDTVVFLARYGRMDPRWVEELDVAEALRYLRKVGDWVKREKGHRADGDVTDPSGEWS